MIYMSSGKITAAVITFAIVAMAICSTNYAQQPTDQSATKIEVTNQLLKDRLIATCEQYSLPAMWAGKFFVDERPPVLEVAGKRKWDAPDLAEADDIIHLGSCTKAMTAAIIGQLCTEGKLRLDSTLADVFRDSTLVTESDWGAVTISQLLQHRSGAVANFLPYQLFDQPHPDSVIAARHALLEALCKKNRPRDPKFVYSNVGYILLGHVAEQLDGKPWEEVVTERLFQPLGMETAGFGPVGRPDGTPNNAPSLPTRAWGHTPSVNLMT